jgi:cell division protease FtsH
MGMLARLPTQVTLIPRGQARGLTWFTPGEDPSLISKSQIFARIVSALGGRAAEQVIFGDPEVTTGASGDLQQVFPTDSCAPCAL